MTQTNVNDVQVKPVSRTQKAFLFASILFTALAWGPAAAHMLELPNKIDLPASDYLVVQQNYRGWALLGIVVVGALISTIGFAVVVRGTTVFRYALTAVLCVAATQVIFWTFTFPANRQSTTGHRYPRTG